MKKLLLCSLLTAAPALAQPASAPATQPAAAPAEVDRLRADVEALSARLAAQEEASLILEAEAAASRGPGEAALAVKTFRGGERSLQGLNPELSVVGDLFGLLVVEDGETVSDRARSGFYLCQLGFHVQSSLDPFSTTKMAIGVSPAGAELGEAYMTWHSVTPRLAVTIGKFRQQLGVVNRWHKPGLDQFDFPLMLTENLGPGGLNQVGVSAQLRLPALWADAIDAELQITNGMNPKLYAGDLFSVPSALLHLRSYWDASRNTYVELGLTGMGGTNHAVGGPTPEDARVTLAGAVDFTINWEPVNQAKYKGLNWRSEGMIVHKEALDAAGAPTVIWSGGAYTALTWKFARNWFLGARLDLARPLQLDNDELLTRGLVAHLTFWQSPWVRLRLEYDVVDWAAGSVEHRGILQTTFAAGPHKHERY